MQNNKAAFQKGLRRTKARFFDRLKLTLLGKQYIDEAKLDEIEEALLSADVGLDTTQHIIANLGARAKQQRYLNQAQLLQLLKDELQDRLPTAESNPYQLTTEAGTYVILLVGVNGVGKTTTAARLAHSYQQRGTSVVLGAADTFRAAAIDQLQKWGERLDLPVVAKEMGSDPSAVAFATLNFAQKHHTQVAIIDTAGRLHNKKHLMEELAKFRRVMAKVVPAAPQEVLLVLDASTGQNAFAQAEAFWSATQVTGFVLTKLDGTAKGGVLLGVAAKYNLPIRYVGLGEGLSDLHPFTAKAYIDALF